MSKEENGGEAFPISYPAKGCVVEHGITKRDYFAAKAMQAMLAFPAELGRGADSENMSASAFCAEAAYEFADAMLEARK